MKDRRRLKVDDKAFSELTELSAYWAGFLMADGCIQYTPGQTPQVTLSISNKDQEHLQAFREFVKAENKIVHTRNSVMLSFRSYEIARDLGRYGIFPRKSHSTSVKILTQDRHFWRGMVDGDGCVGIYGGYPRLDLVGMHGNIKTFLSFIRQICPDCLANVHKHGNIYALRLCGSFAARASHTLYDSNNICLQRKWDKVKEMGYNLSN